MGAWTPFTHLLGRSDGTRPRYNADHAPVGGRHPTAQWQPGTFVSERVPPIQPSQNLPPGTYELIVGLWDTSSKATGVAGRALVDTSEGTPSPLADNEQRVGLIKIDKCCRRSRHRPRRPRPTDSPSGSIRTSRTDSRARPRLGLRARR